MTSQRSGSKSTASGAVNRGVSLAEVAPGVPQAGRYDAFLSYARTDAEFAVDELRAGLMQRGLRIWLDVEDIQGGSLWRERIRRGIEACKAFLFVISPDSLASPACAEELDVAVQAHKRIIPVVYRDPGTTELPEALAAHEWIFLRATDDAAYNTEKLVDALQTDLEWRDRHTRLTGRAREWLDADRDGSYLLRGSDLRDAQAWLAQQAGHRESPTQEQGEYIERSRHAARRRQRTLVGALAIGLLIAIGLAVVAVIQRGDAITNNRHAQGAVDDDQALLDLSTDPAHAVSAALAAVGKRFSQASDVELREAMMGDQLRGYLSGQHGVSALAFDPADDAVLVAGGDGGAARVWNVATRRSLAVLPGPRHGNDVVNVDDVAFNASGTLIATAYNDGTVRLWSTRTDQQVTSPLVAGHGAVVNQVAFQPGRRLLVAGSSNGGAYFFSTATGRLIGRLAPPVGAGAVGRVSFSPNGASVLLGYRNGEAILVGPGQRPVLLGAARHGGRGIDGDKTVAASFSPDGSRIITAFVNGTAELWTANGQPVAGLHIPHGLTGSTATATITAAFSGNGTLVAVGYHDGSVAVFNGHSGALQNIIRTGSDNLYGLMFSPRHAELNYLITLDDSGRTRVWNPLSGEQLSLLIAGGHYVDAIAISPDGSLVVGGETAAGLALWEPLPGDVIGTYAHVLSGAFSPDGTRFALVGRDVRLFDAATGRQLRTVSPHAGSILAPLFSPDGWLLAIPGTAGTALIDLRTGRNLKLTASPAPETPSTYTTAVGDFSPDSRLYAAGSPNGAVTVWSTSTGQVVAHLRRHAGAVTTVQFSPDGRLIASAGLDHMTYLEPADGHGPVRSLRSPEAVAGLSFSPDGRRLATVTTYAGGNGELQLWDARTGRQIGRPVANAGSYLRFLPGGHELITGSSTAGIEVVEVKDAGLRDQGSIGTSDALNAVLLGANEAGGLVLTMELGAERIYSLAGVEQIGTLGVSDHFQTVVSSPSGTRVLTIDLARADNGGGTEVARLYACDACGPLPEARRYAQALLREAAIP